ncbi:type II secretion system protein GspM [Colwelliaceae bacterium 6471]
MKAWWQQLNTREQRLVMAMSAAVIVFILYSLIWQPLNDGIVKAQQKLDRQQELLSWVQENTAKYQRSKVGGNAKGSSGSLSSIINRTARNANITVTRIQPQGDDIQVWVDEVSFEQLLQWLERLTNNDGLQVKAIDLDGLDKPGTVRVRRLQLGKN